MPEDLGEGPPPPEPADASPGGPAERGAGAGPGDDVAPEDTGGGTGEPDESGSGRGETGGAGERAAGEAGGTGAGEAGDAGGGTGEPPDLDAAGAEVISGDSGGGGGGPPATDAAEAGGETTAGAGADHPEQSDDGGGTGEPPLSNATEPVGETTAGAGTAGSDVSDEGGETGEPPADEPQPPAFEEGAGVDQDEVDPGGGDGEPPAVDAAGSSDTTDQVATPAEPGGDDDGGATGEPPPEEPVELGDEPVEPAEEPAEKPGEEPVEPAKEPAAEPGEEPVEPVEEPVFERAGEPGGETAEEPGGETAEEPAERAEGSESGESRVDDEAARAEEDEERTDQAEVQAAQAAQIAEEEAATAGEDQAADGRREVRSPADRQDDFVDKQYQENLAALRSNAAFLRGQGEAEGEGRLEKSMAGLEGTSSSAPDPRADLPAPAAPGDAPEAVRADPDLTNWADADGYQPVHDAPVVVDPAVDTVNQGAIGDCHLVSSICAVTAADPGHWATHIEDHGDTATVTMYRDGQPVPVTVEKSVPVDAAGQQVGAVTVDGSSYGPLVEKAYASEFTGSDYGTLDEGGLPSEAMEALTGRAGQFEQPSALGPGRLGQLVDDGHPVVASTIASEDLAPEVAAERSFEEPGKLAIPDDDPHCYVVTGVDNDGTVHLHNPWGSDHLDIAWAQFERHFDSVEWC